jgi:glyoxylase-like metal-dependent hydrolase (beta-lactamase superfamily II)
MTWNGPIRKNSLRPRLSLAVAILFACAGVAGAKDPAGTAPVDGTEHVHVLPVRGNVYMLAGAGANITVQVGEKYVIVVDTGLPQFADEVIATIRQITKLPIMFVANTTSDADHIGGNNKIFAAGGALPNATAGFAREEEKDKTRLKLLPGATFMYTFNASNRMPDWNGKTNAVTFGREGFKLYNGESAVFYHMGKAHTDGDSMAFFRASDVISSGDIYSTTSYPVIESENGGTIDGYLDSLNDLLELLVPKEGEEGGTYVIPGHGHLSDRADVVNYRDMVTIIRGRIEAMIKKGMTLDQVKAANPTLDYDGIYGAESGQKFTEVVYHDVAKYTKPQGRR